MKQRAGILKSFGQIVVCLGLVFGLGIVSASPARAGDWFWSQSECRADVWWYGIPGEGAWYWHQSTGEIWVGGAVHSTYAAHGYECGWLGAVRTPYQVGDRQYFECGYMVWNGAEYETYWYPWGCNWL